MLRVRGHCPIRWRLDSSTPTAHRDVDVVVLDVSVPDSAGLRALHRLRQLSHIPVLVLASRCKEYPCVRWLDGGADDDVLKPGVMREVVARLEALHRRPWVRDQPTYDLVETMDTSIDLRARTVRVQGNLVRLTKLEFEVLAALARRAGKPVSRQKIMTDVWGETGRSVSRSLNVHLVALRTKLNCPGLLQTVRGFGYRLG